MDTVPGEREGARVLRFLPALPRKREKEERKKKKEKERYVNVQMYKCTYVHVTIFFSAQLTLR